jgi:hypothetical protein
VTFGLQVELQTFGQVGFVLNNQNVTHASLPRVYGADSLVRRL